MSDKLLLQDEIDNIKLSLIKTLNGEEIVKHLSDAGHHPDDSSIAKEYYTLKHDLHFINIAATTLERVMMELSIRAAHHELKREGKIEKGNWTAVGGGGVILAVCKDHTEAVQKATATGNHFIVRWLNFDD